MQPATTLSRFPGDLSEWIGADGLARLATEAVNRLDWNATDEIDQTALAADRRRRALLAILTRCYAAGHYAPELIAAQAASELGAVGLSVSACDSEHLRLFRGQNTGLLLGCLACVFAGAWTMTHGDDWPGDTADSLATPSGGQVRSDRGFRGICRSQAESRLQLACRADAPVLDDRRCSKQVAGPADLRGHPRSVAILCGCVFVAVLLSLLGRAAETIYPVLRLGEQAYTNVTVISANPVELTLHVQGGFKKLGRDELPPELQAKYPYDPEAAAAWVREQAIKEKRQNDHVREDICRALQRREQRAAANLEAARQALNDLDELLRIQINKAKGTRKGSIEHTEANRTRDQKMLLIGQMQLLRRELDALRLQTAAYR